MSANVESMMYVGRKVPWHGLGTAVKEACNSVDAIKFSGLDWEVKQKSIFVDKKKVDGYFANVRTSDDSVLGIVGNRYKIIQNKEAFDFTDSLLDEGVVYETAGSLRDGKTIWLLAKMPETKILGDKFDPYICFTNNHDGFGSIKAFMTPIRVVCNNTLNLALNNTKTSWRATHSGNLSSKIDEARHTLRLANDYMSTIASEADTLAVEKFSDREYQNALNVMFPVPKNATERKVTNLEDEKATVTYCMMAPDLANFKGTKWQFLQAVADYTTHHQNKKASDENRWGNIMSGASLLNLAYNIVTQ